MAQTTDPSIPFAPSAANDRDRDFAATALPLLPNVKRFALSLTRNEADADDIVQETYLRAYRYWGTFAAVTQCRRCLVTGLRKNFNDLVQRQGENPAV